MRKFDQMSYNQYRALLDKMTPDERERFRTGDFEPLSQEDQVDAYEQYMLPTTPRHDRLKTALAIGLMILLFSGWLGFSVYLYFKV